MKLASTQEVFTFEGNNDKAIFNAAINAVPMAGLKVWKTREIALLVLAEGIINGDTVRCNIAVSMVDGSTTITAEAKTLPVSELKAIIQKLKTSLQEVLS